MKDETTDKKVAWFAACRQQKQTKTSVMMTMMIKWRSTSVRARSMKT